MTETQMISEREAVLRERAAYARGYCDGSARWNVEQKDRGETAARAIYPLPKITRPRVLRAVGVLYRVMNGNVQSQTIEGTCCPHDLRWTDTFTVPTNVIEAIYDLITYPLEEIEDSSDV